MITIDYRDRRPIYEQIVQKTEDLVLMGVLQPNDPLPSVRQLAMELSINPNTIQRAYFELEQRGVIYAVKGRGNFVTDDASQLRSQKAQSMYQALRELTAQAVTLRIPCDELLDHCRTFYQENLGGVSL